MREQAFQREKACFEQNHQHARALAEQMSRVPAVSVTLTGGLWFAASQTLAGIDPAMKFALLMFAGVANIGLALSCFRIRDVIQSYFEKIQQFSPENFATGTPKNPLLPRFSRYSMISIYVMLMGLSATLSFFAAFYFYWPFETAKRSSGIAFFLLLAIALAIFMKGRRPA